VSFKIVKKPHIKAIDRIQNELNNLKTAPFLCCNIKQKRNMEDVPSLDIGKQVPLLLREKC